MITGRRPPSMLRLGLYSAQARTSSTYAIPEVTPVDKLLNLFFQLDAILYIMVMVAVESAILLFASSVGWRLQRGKTSQIVLILQCQ